MKRATWYFDFVSPFSYLHNLSLDEFADQLLIDRKPLLFAGLLKHWGTKGPAELLTKRIFTYRHIQWYANRLDIPFRFPERHPFNPIPLLRLCIAKGCSKEAVGSIFRCVWVEGLVGDDPDNWETFCNAVGLNASEANELISTPEVKSKLKSNGENAIEQGVFGVPTLVVDGNLFWGNDSIEFVRDYLAKPKMFENPTMKRLETLPD